MTDISFVTNTFAAFEDMTYDTFHIWKYGAPNNLSISHLTCSKHAVSDNMPQDVLSENLTWDIFVKSQISVSECLL